MNLSLSQQKKVIDFSEKKLYRDLNCGIAEDNESVNVHSLHFDKAYILQGEILISLGRYNEAIKAFELALDINPMSAVAYSSLAYIYDMKNNIKEALLFNQKAFDVLEAADDESELLLSLYDQKMSILSRTNMIADLKESVSQAKKDLSSEDFDYIFDCYKSYFTIDSNRKLFAI